MKYAVPSLGLPPTTLLARQRIATSDQGGVEHFKTALLQPNLLSMMGTGCLDQALQIDGQLAVANMERAWNPEECH